MLSNAIYRYIQLGVLLLAGTWGYQRSLYNLGSYEHI